MLTCARIHGTSWLAFDNAEAQDPYNVFSLFRAHAALSTIAPTSSHKTAHRQHGSFAGAPPQSAIPAPLRLIFPHIPTFSSPNIPPGPGEDPKAHPPPRERAHIGVHPLLPKVVLPSVGLWFEEDWADLAEMHVPFLLERVVVEWQEGHLDLPIDAIVDHCVAVYGALFPERDPG